MNRVKKRELQSVGFFKNFEKFCGLYINLFGKFVKVFLGLMSEPLTIPFYFDLKH